MIYNGHDLGKKTYSLEWEHSFAHLLKYSFGMFLKSFFHCVKSVRIRSFSGPHFPAFGLNTPYLSLLVQKRENTDQKISKYGHFSRCVCCQEVPLNKIVFRTLSNIHGGTFLWEFFFLAFNCFRKTLHHLDI